MISGLGQAAKSACSTAKCPLIALPGWQLAFLVWKQPELNADSNHRIWINEMENVWISTMSDPVGQTFLLSQRWGSGDSGPVSSWTGMTSRLQRPASNPHSRIEPPAERLSHLHPSVSTARHDHQPSNETLALLTSNAARSLYATDIHREMPCLPMRQGLEDVKESHAPHTSVIGPLVLSILQAMTSGGSIR